MSVVSTAVAADCTADTRDRASSPEDKDRRAAWGSHCMATPTEERHYCTATAAGRRARAGTAAEVCTADIDRNGVVGSSSPRHAFIDA